MKKRLFLLSGVLLLGYGVALAQTVVQNCTQKLRTARSTYEQGRLHELPTLLDDCIQKDGFTKAEKIEAHRLLVLTYIYLEEPEMAEKEMINLLHTDKFFTPNTTVDPVEFQNLYHKFRWWQVARVGLRVGFLTNHISTLATQPVWAAGLGKGEYTSAVGTQFGLSYEKDLKKRRKNGKVDFTSFTLAPELMFTSYSFTYTNSGLLMADQPGQGTFDAEHVISQSRLQANLLVKYNIANELHHDDKFIPFVALGPVISYMSASSFEGSTNIGETVTGASINNTDSYKPITFAVMACVGAKLRLGDFFLIADVRYQHGLNNMVDTSKNPYAWSGNTEGLADFGYVDNNFRLSHSSFNLGFVYPIFNIKKLIN